MPGVCGLPASFFLRVGPIGVASKSRKESLLTVLSEAQRAWDRRSPLSLQLPSGCHCPQVVPTAQSRRGQVWLPESLGGAKGEVPRPHPPGPTLVEP